MKGFQFRGSASQRPPRIGLEELPCTMLRCRGQTKPSACCWMLVPIPKFKTQGQVKQHCMLHAGGATWKLFAYWCGGEQTRPRNTPRVATHHCNLQKSMATKTLRKCSGRQTTGFARTSRLKVRAVPVRLFGGHPVRLRF